MSEPKSFDDRQFLKDLEFIRSQLSKTDLGQHPTEPHVGRDATKAGDALTAHVLEEESHLNQELKQACLDTGATGAAIALVRGDEMVCYASAGPQAPGIGVCLDPRTGLSGSCIQTHQFQQCNDTQTDDRVDAEACRGLGVRSVLVLPLVEGNELFGILEVLSPRPNAFSQRDLDSLQALADRIVAGRKQNWEATATVASRESGLLPHNLEEVVHLDKSGTSESASEFPHPEHVSKRNDRITTMLGILVIASSMMLGLLLGWRLGWRKATIGFRASSPFNRANTLPENRQTDRAAFPVKRPQPSFAGLDECGQPGVADLPAQLQSGGLTVCEEGRVIFRLPPSAVSPIRDLRTSRRSPRLTPNTARP